MAVKTRRDRHGRVLAPSRRNSRHEIVVETSAESIDEARMAALGVDMSSGDKPQAAAGGREQGGGGQPAGEYPIDRGGGWFELSNGERVRGEDDALQAEARIQGGEE